MNVLQGFAVIAVIVTVGVFLARSGVLGQAGQTGLSKLAFNVATPALLFTLMADAHLEVLYSSQFVVTAIAMTAVALIYGAVGALRKWGLATTTSGAMAASYVNAGNLGIPIADLADLIGGSPQHNAEVLRRTLAGETGAVRDIVLLNAAAGIVAFELSQDATQVQRPILERLREGYDKASAAVDDGRALAKLDQWISVSRELAAPKE